MLLGLQLRRHQLAFGYLMSRFFMEAKQAIMIGLIGDSRIEDS
jgi:hypothetical protein